MAGTYQPGPYRMFYVTEGVRRKISAAPFRDRVVHHPVHRVIEPLFDREFIFDSYASGTSRRTGTTTWVFGVRLSSQRRPERGVRGGNVCRLRMAVQARPRPVPSPTTGR